MFTLCIHFSTNSLVFKNEGKPFWDQNKQKKTTRRTGTFRRPQKQNTVAVFSENGRLSFDIVNGPLDPGQQTKAVMTFKHMLFQLS